MSLSLTILLIWQELQERVNQEQSVIMQTSNALNQCCGINSTFAGSQEAVECHKLLLIACKSKIFFNRSLIIILFFSHSEFNPVFVVFSVKFPLIDKKMFWFVNDKITIRFFTLGKKREAYISEMHRLRQGREEPHVGPRGSLTVTDIRLPLKQNFMQNIGGPSGKFNVVWHNLKLIYDQL